MPIPIATQNQVMSQLYPVIRIGSLQIGDFLSQYNSYSHANYLIECLRIEREKIRWLSALYLICIQELCLTCIQELVQHWTCG